MTPALLLVAHGSRDPRFADTARRVRAAVAERLPAVDVQLSYLDLDRPLTSEALARMSGAAVVVPLLLAPGHHSEVDVPSIVREHATHPVVCTDVVGAHGLTTALADRLREAGLRRGDGIVLTAVGSTNPSAASMVRRRAIELSTMLHHPVDVVFGTRLGTGDLALRTAIRRLHTAGCTRIVLSPYFLSAGLLTERVENALDRWAPGALVAGPIGAHPQLVSAVAEAYARGLSRRETPRSSVR
ncbi:MULTISPECIES: sirohydrochlorin chelatase [unclassified Gordonia (in: high G+C Gram-positive bacteria)]